MAPDREYLVSAGRLLHQLVDLSRPAWLATNVHPLFGLHVYAVDPYRPHLAGLSFLLLAIQASSA
jgi:hypothetical protein